MTDPTDMPKTPEERIDALETQVAELIAVVARLELARLDEAGDRVCRDAPRARRCGRVLVDCEGNGEG